MQDLEAPPAVAEEAETDAGVAGVRLIAALSTVVIVNNTAASTPPLWTIATALLLAETMVRVPAASGRASLPPTIQSTLNRCRPRRKTLFRASSPLSTTFSLSPKFR